MKISVITPSVRPEGLDMVRSCLNRQTFKDWEWIVVSPFEYKEAIWVPEPPKPEGYNYNLNRAWNTSFKKARGELFVSIVDMMWFDPETLENLWYHYHFDKMQCIGGVGHHYEYEWGGRPESLVWTDPRVRGQEQFYQISPIDFELCLASIPLQAIHAVGGMDEVFDQYAAMSEKELCARIEKLGYTFWIDQTLEYRAIHHPRLTKDWDDRYFAGVPYFQQCLSDIQSGKRRKLDFLSQKDYIKENGVSEKEPASE